jgi:hypothetical protein
MGFPAYLHTLPRKCHLAVGREDQQGDWNERKADHLDEPRGVIGWSSRSKIEENAGGKASVTPEKGGRGGKRRRKAKKENAGVTGRSMRRHLYDLR